MTPASSISTLLLPSIRQRPSNNGLAKTAATFDLEKSLARFALAKVGRTRVRST